MLVQLLQSAAVRRSRPALCLMGKRKFPQKTSKDVSVCTAESEKKVIFVWCTNHVDGAGERSFLHHHLGPLFGGVLHGVHHKSELPLHLPQAHCAPLHVLPLSEALGIEGLFLSHPPGQLQRWPGKQ